MTMVDGSIQAAFDTGMLVATLGGSAPASMSRAAAKKLAMSGAQRAAVKTAACVCPARWFSHE